eukprot:TRINITY_DN7982_c0_g1_i1.p1 TRINITY_DN7982_c0_g1~~TRINITY_DN7982_c0_g1_i1.p1  ORF type:complete len:876 (+),score=207.88 TRINITY_DN7982_c0_g1_i1:23-2650(+)
MAASSPRAKRLAVVRGLAGLEAPSPVLRRRFQAQPAEDPNTFRCEDGTSSAEGGLDSSTSDMFLENPEAETRWYFRYFLGKAHSNYVFHDGGEVLLMSVVHEADEKQVRAILWRKEGSIHVTVADDKVIKSRQVDHKRLLALFNVAADGPIEEIVDPNAQQRLLILEEQEGAVNFKIGVLYARPGQQTDDEMFSNETGSPGFEEFCDLIGTKIELQGWQSFRGGLDVRNGSTGQYSYHTVEYGKEIMFHVSTLLPYSTGNKQQLERKRHLGNDICNIVYVDGELPDFDPSNIKSQFNHMFVLVQRLPNGSYSLKAFIKQSVPEFGPQIPNPPIFTEPDRLRRFLLVKLLNGEKAALSSPHASFAQKKTRTLEALITSIYTEAKSSRMLLPVNKSRSKTKRMSKHEPEFRATGQAIKVDKIAAGVAPTSSLSESGGSVKEPWQPICITTELNLQVLAGDQWGTDLVVASMQGVFLITIALHKPGALQMTQLIDASIMIAQISVDERANCAVFRSSKDPDVSGSLSAAAFRKSQNKRNYLFIVPLDKLMEAITTKTPLTKKALKAYSLDDARGCHLFTLQIGSNATTSNMLRQTCKLAVAVGKKIRAFAYGSVGAGDTGTFTLVEEFTCSDVILSVAIGHGEVGTSGEICVGVASGDFQLIQLSSPYAVSVLLEGDTFANRIEPYACEEITDSEVREFMLSFNRSTAFKDRQGDRTRGYEIHWRSQPQRLVYSYPYLMAFANETIQISTLINGNLVKSISLPNVRCITGKADIFFSSFNRDDTLSLFCIPRSNLSGRQGGEASLDRLPTHVVGSQYMRKMSLENLSNFTSPASSMGDLGDRQMTRVASIPEGPTAAAIPEEEEAYNGFETVDEPFSP